MKLSKKQVQELYEKSLYLAKTKPPEFFGFRKMRGTVGLCYWTDIELDYRRDLIPTAFHELLHYIHPDWSESNILYAESRIMNVCTSLEIARFLKHLSYKLYKSEVQKHFLQKSSRTKSKSESDWKNESTK